MYHIAADRRSQRSAQTIADTLSQVIDEGGFETLRISELANRAGLGRATFYRNFDAVEDVLRWQCDVSLQRLGEYVRAHLRMRPSDEPYPLLRPFLRFFAINSRIVELLIATGRTDILQEAFAREIGKLEAAFPPLTGVSADHLEYRPVVRSAMVVSVLVHWIGNGKRHPPDELADGLSQITRQMIDANALI